MVILRFILLGILLGFSSVYADEASKAEKLKELMRVQGLYDMIEQQQMYSEAQAKSLEQQIMGNLENKYHGMIPEKKLAFKKATERFINYAKASWTVTDAVEAWQQYYGASVTEAELDQILAFYKSPIGQKHILATKMAMPKWNQYFAEKTQGTLEKAMQTYMKELDEIVNSIGQDTGQP